jgi:hypothetical protein
MKLAMHIPDDTSSQIDQQSVAEALLQSLLPVNYKLEFNADLHILSLLHIDTPRILAQEQFTRNEWSILLAILSSYPYYTSYETLLASITSLTPVYCRKRLQEVQQLGSKAMKQELKPVHRAISSTRNKLYNVCPFLKISLIRELGYNLTISPDCF